MPRSLDEADHRGDQAFEVTIVAEQDRASPTSVEATRVAPSEHSPIAKRIFMSSPPLPYCEGVIPSRSFDVA